MRAIVKPLPVVYACQGCPEYGQVARDAGEALERAGLAELVWLGGARLHARAERYPILALDGCDKACALQWLQRRRIPVDRSYVLPEVPL